MTQNSVIPRINLLKKVKTVINSITCQTFEGGEQELIM